MSLDPATSDLQGLEFQAGMERSGKRGIVAQAVAFARNRCLGGENCEWAGARNCSKKPLVQKPLGLWVLLRRIIDQGDVLKVPIAR